MTDQASLRMRFEMGNEGLRYGSEDGAPGYIFHGRAEALPFTFH
jgi:hypothetical protein